MSMFNFSALTQTIENIGSMVAPLPEDEDGEDDQQQVEEEDAEQNTSGAAAIMNMGAGFLNTLLQDQPADSLPTAGGDLNAFTETSTEGEVDDDVLRGDAVDTEGDDAADDSIQIFFSHIRESILPPTLTANIATAMTESMAEDNFEGNADEVLSPAGSMVSVDLGSDSNHSFGIKDLQGLLLGGKGRGRGESSTQAVKTQPASLGTFSTPELEKKVQQKYREQLEAEISNYDQRYRELEQSAEALEREIQQLRGEGNVADDRSSQVNLRISSPPPNRHDTVRQDSLLMKKQLSDRDEQIDKLQQLIRDQEVQFADRLRKKEEEWQQSNADMKDLVTCAGDRIKEIEAECDALRHLQHDVEVKDAQLENLQKNMALAENKLKSVDAQLQVSAKAEADLREKLVGAVNKSELLEAEVLRLRQETDQMEQDHSQEVNALMTKHNEDLRNNKNDDASVAECGTLRVQLQQTQMELDASVNRMETLSADCDRKLNDSQFKIQQLEEMIVTLNEQHKSELEELRASGHHVDVQHRQQQKELKEEVTNLRDQLTTADGKLAAKERTLAEAQQYINLLESDTEKLNEQIQNLHDQIQHVSEEKEQIRSAQKEGASAKEMLLQQQLTDREQQLASFNIKLDSIILSNQENEEKVVSLTDECASLRERWQAAEKQMTEMKQQADEARTASIEALNKAEQEKNESISKCDQLESKIDELTRERDEGIASLALTQQQQKQGDESLRAEVDRLASALAASEENVKATEEAAWHAKAEASELLYALEQERAQVKKKEEETAMEVQQLQQALEQSQRSLEETVVELQSARNDTVEMQSLRVLLQDQASEVSAGVARLEELQLQLNEEQSSKVTIQDNHEQEISSMKQHAASLSEQLRREQEVLVKLKDEMRDALEGSEAVHQSLQERIKLLEIELSKANEVATEAASRASQLQIANDELDTNAKAASEQLIALRIEQETSVREFENAITTKNNMIRALSAEQEQRTAVSDPELVKQLESSVQHLSTACDSLRFLDTKLLLLVPPDILGESTDDVGDSLMSKYSSTGDVNDLLSAFPRISQVLLALSDGVIDLHKSKIDALEHLYQRDASVTEQLTEIGGVLDTIAHALNIVENPNNSKAGVFSPITKNNSNDGQESSSVPMNSGELEDTAAVIHVKCSAVHSSVQELIDMLHMTSDQRRDVEQELDRLTKKVETTFQENAEQQQLLNSRINDLQQWLIDAQNEKAEAEKRAAGMKLDLQRLQEENIALKEQCSTGSKAIQSQLQSAEEQYQSAKKQLHKLETENRQLHQVISQLRQVRKASKGEADEIVAERDMLRTQCTQQLEEISRLQLKAVNSDAAVKLQADLQAVQQQLMEAQNLIAQLEKDLYDKETELETLKSDTMLIAQELEQRQLEVNNLKDAMQYVESEHAGFQTQARREMEQQLDDQRRQYEISRQLLEEEWRNKLKNEEQLRRQFQDKCEDDEVIRRKIEVDFSREKKKMQKTLENALTALNNSQRDVIDRQLVANLIVSYFKKKRSLEVLGLISNVLNFTDEQKEAVGVKVPDINFLTSIVSTVLGPPPRQPPPESEGDNLAEMWINFLMNETEEKQASVATGGSGTGLKMPAISSDDFDEDAINRSSSKELSPMIGQEQL